ncbi:hypothetical protein CQA01_03780 [Cyclobacterium qasimii]|uniref:Secretion system C-terminal sorting domain-containing protein n=2 Tax=Cyclobacterium qasimii TaxID=1350429 RepID=A0A512C6K3_9BACT|nr:hypothetical protein CQA01_03780 [Cyclobacterium qasimii]
MAFSISNSYASNYYVSDKTGDDTRTLEEAQNPATPWKSIEKVNSQFNKLKPGDGILFKRGETFYGTLHIEASGSASSPITIGSYGSGSKPIITSFQSIKGWKAIGNGIYESIDPVNSNTVQVLLIDGKINEMGRYPNIGIENDGYLTINRTETNVIYSEQLLSYHNWKGADIVIKAKDWIINRYKIESQTGQQIHYNGSISPYSAQVGYGFFISNHISTLDSFGEWFFNPTNKKISVYFGNEDPSTKSIEVSTLDNLLTKDYLESNISIQNLQFKGANENILQLEGGDNIKVSDSEISFSGEDGIHALGVVDLLIERNIVRQNYNNGLFLKYGNDGAIVRDNEITNTGLISGRTRNDDAAGIGIFASGENILIQNNSIINTGFNGIQFSGNYTVVKNNFVDTYCLIKSDGGGIYTFGGTEYQSYRGRRIEENIVLNGIGSIDGAPKRGVEFKLLAEGIFLDDNSNNVSIIGNTVGNITNSGLKISNGNTISVSDNLFFNTHAAITLGNSIIGNDTRKVNIENNQFFTMLPDQYSYSVKTYKADISLMADFDKNYFFRPLGDEFSILSQYLKNGVIEETLDDLNHWSAKYNKDKNSTSNTIDISTYTIGKKIGNSLYDNATFDKSIAGASCNDCQASWDANNKLTGGALKVANTGTSSVKINLGALKKDKTYLLSLKGYATKVGNLAFNLRFTDSPWERLSPISTIELNTAVNTFELAVSPYEDESEVSLIIHSYEANITYWLDDLELVEVEATLIKPEEVMLFETNPTKNNKTITLAGTYVDAKLEQYSGEVTIPPYGSLALILLTENSIPKEDSQDLHFHTGNQEAIKFNNLNFEKINSKFISSSGSNTYTNTEASNEIIFQSERFATELAFEIPIENGTYTVKTYHNELYFGKGGTTAKAGNRVFDILVENELVQDDFDIYTQGNNDPTTLTFDAVQVIDGVLNLQLIASVNNASISGISIIREVIEEVPQLDLIYFLNTGGTTDETLNGITFLAESDTKDYFNLGSGRFENAEIEEEALFQTERNGKNLLYTFPVPNGTYTVFTMHNELWFGHAGGEAEAGKRVYDIALQGEVLKDNFDIFVENHNSPTLLSFENIIVSDGTLNLEMAASVNNASISGIAIIGNEANDPNFKVNLKGMQEYYTNRTKGEEPSIEVKTRIFPNPSEGAVTLEIIAKIENGSVFIHNMNGNLVSQFDWVKTEENILNFPLENLPKGIYIISVSNEQTIVHKQKLIVNP